VRISSFGRIRTARVHAAVAIVPKPKDSPSVVALDVVDVDGAKAVDLRDAEADVVADLCSRLAGHWQVRDKETKGGRGPAALATSRCWLP
jgi:hypothetical protein